jgi:hypothetical protein
VTVPAKAWAETASARALAAKPAKCLRIIKIPLKGQRW